MALFFANAVMVAFIREMLISSVGDIPISVPLLGVQMQHLPSICQVAGLVDVWGRNRP